MRTSKRALPGRLKVELAGVATDPAELITDDAESRHAKPATLLHSHTNKCESFYHVK